MSNKTKGNAIAAMVKVIKKGGNGNATQEDLMEAIAEALGASNGDAGKIVTETVFSKEIKRIIIPEGMSKKAAAQDLMNQWENEENTQNFSTSFEEWDYKDVLRAIMVVTEDMFGWLKGEHGWFSTPTEIAIVTDIKNGSRITEKAYYGKIGYPVWENAQGNIGIDDNGVVHITLNGKKKFSNAINEYFNALRNHLANSSIYRGKAISVKKGPGGRLELELFEPMANDRIVLNTNVQEVVDNFVIENLGEPGKRTVLFTGNFGNGKTETAMAVGRAGLEKQIAFFYVEDSALLPRVLKFAKNYEPALVFLEDIDEIAAGEARDNKINGILNTLDGVLTKGRNIMTLFTTNNEKSITPALRRPGRIDQIVHFTNPDKGAVKKICELYFRDIKGFADLDWDTILDKMPDVSGSVIAEICKRAAKLSRKHNQVTTERVTASIHSMSFQIDFMKEEVDKKGKVAEALATLRDVLNGGVPVTA